MGAEKTRWQRIQHSFKYSNYITDGWNWLVTLLSKSAEFVLFASVLYSGYQMLPGIEHANQQIDAVIFIIQQAALDIGGLGLLKLAKKAGLKNSDFPMIVGYTLVGLMIMNVIMASIQRSVPSTPAWVFQVVEALLLVARSVMAVLYGHAIHALREEHGESNLSMKDVKDLQNSLQASIDELSKASSQDLAQRVDQLSSTFNQKLTELAERLQNALNESSTVVSRNLQEDLAAKLASTRESFHLQLADLADLSSASPEVQGLQAQIQELTKSFHVLQGRESPPEKPVRPTLHALPSHQSSLQVPRQSELVKASTDKFDARLFVFESLQKDSTCKLSDIQKLAKLQGQELSEASISRYRKQFFASRESSSMQSGSSNESSTLQVVNE